MNNTAIVLKAQTAASLTYYTFFHFGNCAVSPSFGNVKIFEEQIKKLSKETGSFGPT